jgi:uncharacterized membrane protein YbhN (UPF0104 family)
MLNALSHKSKQFFFVLIKISIVVFAFYFIYLKLSNNRDFEYSVFIEFLNENKVFTLNSIISLLFLSCFNWFLEILKWRKLVSVSQKITFKIALEQSLGSLTASLFTPNRIGEYGAKAIYFKNEYRKRIMLINLLSNLLQMSVTVILGGIGLYFFVSEYQISLNTSKILLISIITILFIVLAVVVIGKTRFRIKRFSLEKMKGFIINYPKRIIIQGFCLSLLRYLIFSFQFYYLLTIFQIETSYLHSMMVITTMYLLASIIPSIFIFDVVVKGSVAVYLFTFIGVNAITVLSIVTIMWLFNFVLPGILGSYHVLNFKFPKETVSL